MALMASSIMLVNVGVDFRDGRGTVGSAVMPRKAYRVRAHNARIHTMPVAARDVNKQTKSKLKQ